MVTLKRRIDRLPFAPIAAIMFGAAAAALVAEAPVALLERGVIAIGLPQFLAIAEPPLGLKARLLAIALVFLAVTGLLWLVLRPFERWLERDRRRRTPWADGGYAVSNAAPAPVDMRRKPIFAPDELGAPLMSDAALASVAPPLDPVPELEAPIAEAELAETEGAPLPVASPWTPTTSPDGETSIHALIRRLESGLARRGGGSEPDPDSGPGPGIAAPLALAREWIVRDAAADTGADGAGSPLSQLRRLAFR